jgi:hypothetical protein
MAAVDDVGGAASPSHVCHAAGCPNLKWQTRVKGTKREVAVSDYCFDCSHLRMLEVPAEPVKPKPGRRNPDAIFRTEVARRSKGTK